jgi:hypothetical protein
MLKKCMLIFTKNNMKRQICTMAKSYLRGHTFNRKIIIFTKKIGKCLIFFFIKIISCELRLFKQLTIEDFVIKAVSKDMFVIQ